MRLVAILNDGSPAEPIALPEEARDVAAGYRGLYAAVGCVPPWIGYLALEGERCVGTCGFKAPPADGRVEIAYYTFPRYEGHGRATQMACLLVEIARVADPSLVIAAQTLPRHGPSTRILRRLGFRNAGLVQHPQDGEVWEWRLE